MFKKIIEWFQKGQMSGVEAYIVSKHPQNAADVDYWHRQYDFERARMGF